MPLGFWRRHRIFKWFAVSLLIALVLLGIAIDIAAHRAEPFLRVLIVQRLEEHFHARVELDSFHISVAHGLLAEGKGLRIWPPASVAGVAVPGSNEARNPLVTLAEFHFRAPIHFVRGKPIHIWAIALDGLRIDVPPRPHLTHAADVEAPAPSPSGRGAALLAGLRFQIDSVQCNNARLTLETSVPGKEPLQFDIKTVRITHVNAAGAMEYAAVLTNPRPAGLITAKGTMGPWVVEDPGETPVAGAYRFDHADLSVFKGIAGILNSTGKYQGTLRAMVVDGTTDTPDFALTRFGTAVPLHTSFHARVDGTNGDTWLEPVTATLGNSQFTARGKIVQAPAPAGLKAGGPHGHNLNLTVDVEHGQIGDFMRLTSRSGQPLLNGTLHVKTDFELSPGSNPVDERMRLAGSFRLEDAQFSNPKLQERIGELSLRGQGMPDAAKTAAAADVRSTMEGDFTIKDGDVHLPHLVYIVPGAEIDLHGAYGIDGGSLSFSGTARMDATISHLVGGWKGWLLKPVDPLFRKDGAGTKVKVHVYGTRKDPQFGVDF